MFRGRNVAPDRNVANTITASQDNGTIRVNANKVIEPMIVDEVRTQHGHLKVPDISPLYDNGQNVHPLNDDLPFKTITTTTTTTGSTEKLLTEPITINESLIVVP
ncbi:hypothetical protein Zmor_008802 [Zophobas morio]|uniref:Uncharacterized protein n=1 Tax=Zophobas morio TaxID=2755281 RepID=A0AA38LZ67_9CUCU|nr:hypothetical protein Zmor_008802 [Zophobas morio]